MKERHISHLEFVDARGDVMHESLSSHLRCFDIGQHVAIAYGGSVIAIGAAMATTFPRRAQLADNKTYRIEHASRHQIGDARRRVIVELMIAVECQTLVQVSPRMEVTPSA